MKSENIKKIYLEKIENGENNKKNEIVEPILINEYKSTPVITGTYIWKSECCLCNKNAVGTIKTSLFYYLITSPSFLNEKKEITKLSCCEKCIEKFDLTNFNKTHEFIDKNKNIYKLKGFEDGQWRENLTTI